MKEIYEIFDLNYLNNELFGVYVQQLNGHNIAFISLNTAWSCLGDKDERNLVLGDWTSSVGLVDRQGGDFRT